MGTHSLPFVNGGEPFEVTPKSITPAADKRALVAKAHILKEAMKDTAGMSDRAVDLLHRDAIARAGAVMLSIYVHDILSRADPSLRNVPHEEVLAKLDAEQVVAIMADLSPAPKEKKDGPLGDQ